MHDILITSIVDNLERFEQNDSDTETEVSVEHNTPEFNKWLEDLNNWND